MTVVYGLALDPRLWLGLGAVLWGMALGWATRWNHRTALRSWSMALGANLGAVSVLAAVLLAGSGELNAAHRPLAWGVVFGGGFTWGFLVIRLPRTVGLPLSVLILGLSWWAVSDLRGLAPWTLSPLAEVRVLSQSPAARTVELRVAQGLGRVEEAVVDLPAQGWPLARLERLDLPTWVPVTPLQWWRPTDAPPSGIWNALPATWRIPVVTGAPEAPQPWVVYRLVTRPSGAAWEQVLPALQP